MEKIPMRTRDAWLLKPKVFRDARGFFLECWSRKAFRDIGLDIDFVQDNHSRSARHVLRGLHYQAGDAAQGKLAWVTSGSAFVVIVDLRVNSPTFGVWEGHTLSADAHDRIWVPPGCAHGFLVLSDACDYHYKCSKPYNPTAERFLQWDDPELGIIWPLPPGVKPLLSAKDAAAPPFAECEKYDTNPQP